MLRPLLTTAQAKQAQLHFAEAYAIYKNIITTDPKNIEAYIGLAQVCFQLYKKKKTKHDPEGGLIAKVGSFFFKSEHSHEGYFDEAFAAAKNALQLDPNSENAAECLAKLYTEKKLYADAQKHFRKESTQASIHLQRGRVFYSQNQIQEAQDEFKQVIAIEPENPRAHTCLADTYRKQEEIMLALEFYAKGVELSKNSDEKNKAFSKFYNLYKGHTVLGSAGLERLKTAIKELPTERAFYFVSFLRKNSAKITQKQFEGHSKTAVGFTPSPAVPPLLPTSEIKALYNEIVAKPRQIAKIAQRMALLRRKFNKQENNASTLTSIAGFFSNDCFRGLRIQIAAAAADPDLPEGPNLSKELALEIAKKECEKYEKIYSKKP